MKPICIIAPYQEFADTTKQLIKEFNIPAHVLVANLEEALTMAFEQISKGAEIIVSRGGTANLLRRDINIPVVEVPISTLDVLQAIEELLITNKRNIDNLTIGLVGFNNVIHGVDIISSILNIKVHSIAWFDKENEVIEQIRECGINFIIGDAATNKLSKKCGIESFLIKTHKETILTSLKESNRLLEVRRLEQEKTKLFSTILDASKGGVVAVDRSDKILVFNHAAESILKIKAENAIGAPSKSICHDIMLNEVISCDNYINDIVINVQNKSLSVSRMPIVVNGAVTGAVATIEDVTKIQKLEQAIRRTLSSKGFIANFTFANIIGKSPTMINTISQAKKFSSTDSTILIQGESGTGKEMFAQSIHNASMRKDGPFVAINCAALPDNLLESELFGYEEGAFTGARKGGKHGLFELAHGGTLLLDEIGEMSIELQSRLLRVIQSKEVMRLGDDKVIPIDVRIIAATNRNLYQEVKEKKFREDLYYRLNVLGIGIPPLRERVEDIPTLIKYFTKILSQRLEENEIAFSPGSIRLLEKYLWPGNIRELENLLERLTVLYSGKLITSEFLLNTFPFSNSNPLDSNINVLNTSLAISAEGTLADMEREIIIQVLENENGNHSKAAERLNIDRSTIYRKLK